MKWTISVPCWGVWHTDLFYKYALPSHLKMGLEGCRYIIHTKDEKDFKRARDILSGVCEVEVRVKPHLIYSEHARYRTMNDCHLDAMKDSEAVLFLPPDAVVSSNTRKAIEASGKSLVMVCSLRTMNGEAPPEGPVELNEWAVEHLHPNAMGWIWENPTGTQLIHSHVYFSEGKNFWCHAFHLHPLFAVLDRTYKAGKTIDSFLPNYYKPEEMWVVSNSEIAMATIDRPETHSGLSRERETISSIVDTVRNKIKDRHLGFFQTPIKLRGEIGNTNIPAEITAAIGRI